jgi:hypothetical protein
MFPGANLMLLNLGRRGRLRDRNLRLSAFDIGAEPFCLAQYDGMHEHRCQSDDAKKPHQTGLRGHNQPDSTLSVGIGHWGFSFLLHPGGEDEGKHMRDNRDGAKTTRSVDDIAVQLFGFCERKACRIYFLWVCHDLCSLMAVVKTLSELNALDHELALYSIKTESP